MEPLVGVLVPDILVDPTRELCPDVAAELAPAEPAPEALLPAELGLDIAVPTPPAVVEVGV